MVPVVTAVSGKVVGCQWGYELRLRLALLCWGNNGKERARINGFIGISARESRNVWI